MSVMPSFVLTFLIPLVFMLFSGRCSLSRKLACSQPILHVYNWSSVLVVSLCSLVFDICFLVF